MCTLGYQIHSLRLELDAAVSELQFEVELSLAVDTEACLLMGCDGRAHYVSEPYGSNLK